MRINVEYFQKRGLGIIVVVEGKGVEEYVVKREGVAILDLGGGKEA